MEGCGCGTHVFYAALQRYTRQLCVRHNSGRPDLTGGAQRSAAPQCSMTGMTAAGSAAGARLREAEQAENFPVALRVLPAPVRRRLRVVYDVVRTIDDLGDEGDLDTGARLAALEDFRADLARVWQPGDGPVAPSLTALRPFAAELPERPFADLVAANVADQHVARYPTWAELDGYCALSANPIGRLVLAVFAVEPTEQLVAASDQVCTALQVLEHCQDVAEDHARGRVYLPAAELRIHGVDADELLRYPARLQAAVAAATARARSLLDEGAPVLRGALRGWARLAVAGYVAGGRAAADALHRAGYDVLSGAPQARKADVVRHLIGGPR
jgi:squalene synthase HpnC